MQVFGQIGEVTHILLLIVHLLIHLLELNIAAHLLQDFEKLLFLERLLVLLDLSLMLLLLLLLLLTGLLELRDRILDICLGKFGRNLVETQGMSERWKCCLLTRITDHAESVTGSFVTRSCWKVTQLQILAVLVLSHLLEYGSHL